MEKTSSMWMALGAGLLAVALGGALLIARSGPAVVTALTGDVAPQEAPNFKLKLFSGKTFSLSQFRDKKPVVVNFWASWCGPCRAEAPVLSRVSKRFESKIKFVGVVVNDKGSSAQAFMKEFGITYDNGLDPGNIAEAYRVTGIPSTFWIDKSGRVAGYWVGAIEEADLVRRTEELL